MNGFLISALQITGRPSVYNEREDIAINIPLLPTHHSRPPRGALVNLALIPEINQFSRGLNPLIYALAFLQKLLSGILKLLAITLEMIIISQNI